MAIRTGTAQWDGDLRNGDGSFSGASGALDGKYSFESRFGESGGTNPEELVAAAHSACYAMSLSNLVTGAGGTVQALDVSADVTLGPDEEAGGFKLTGIVLRVRGEVDGLDDAAFKDAAEKAKAECPISKALAAVDITLDAALEG